jgi:hypothetical protein
MYGCLVFLWFLGGCSAFPATRALGNPGLPTPTGFSLFRVTTMPVLATGLVQPVGGKPTAANFFSQQPTRTPMLLPTSIPIMDVLPTRTIPTSSVFTNSIFSDQLSPNWNLSAGTGMRVDPENSTYVHSGNVSLAMTPQRDFSKLNFYVSQNSTLIYPRDQVTAISFWLNSGNDTVILSDLIVRVLGSNTTPYWVANDNSVPIDNDILLQETRLYFLGLNKTIPADTWVEVTINFDNLTHDPDYKYVTGFYIKNDAGFLRTVYIDDVDIWMIDNGRQLAPAAIPEITAIPVPTTSAESAQTATSRIPSSTQYTPQNKVNGLSGEVITNQIDVYWRQTR